MRIFGPNTKRKITNREKNTRNKSQPQSDMHILKIKIMVYHHQQLPRLFERDSDAHLVHDLFGVSLQHSISLRVFLDFIQNILRHYKACVQQILQQHEYRHDSYL
jgi:hypothetical protein